MKNIDPARWQQIEKILDEALDKDPAAREEYVQAACGDDDDLRESVLKMLKASGDSEKFLESGGGGELQNALAKMAAVVEDDDSEKEEMQTVGPYRLIRKLGRGGMGQVYLAVRDDEAFKRYVAIKVIRRGMDTEDILKRFRVERQILASLTHPGIARLLDGGATDEGVSYFVMEYVDGETVDKYCNDNRLSLEDRLQLFVKICEAVHYAHQNLIVHRDLKPGNILITREGDVKLLDFGIAKFLNPDLTGYTLPMTRTELRVMTPEYASPEQVRGNSLTTASDVYQLGILMYELLTGHRPFTFETQARGEIEKIILEQAPEKPSTIISRVEELPAAKSSLTPETVSLQRRTPLDRLRKQLTGDLDHIVLMALRKETDRRYQSADQLLQDIQNYLAGKPVSAQADTISYRTRKFVQRNKAAVTGAVLGLLLLVATTVMAVQFAVVTAEQRDEIVLEAQKSAEFVSFMMDLFEKANPEYAQGRELTVRELLNIGADDVANRLTAHPEVQSELLGTLSLVFADLGDREQGTILARSALRIQTEISGEEDSPFLADALFAMGVLMDDNGEAESSIDFHEQSLAMRRRLFGELHLDVAHSLNALGVTLYGLRPTTLDTTRVVWEQALDIRRNLLGESHRDIAESLSNLGAVFGDLHYYADPGSPKDDMFGEAETYFREALDMTRTERGENHPFFASNLHNFGSTLYDAGVYREAEQQLLQAVEKRSLIYGRQSDPTANSLNYLGRIFEAQGDYENAEPFYRESLEIHRVTIGRTSWRLGMDHLTLGRTLQNKGDIDGALDLYFESYAILQETVEANDPRLALANRALAGLLEEAGRFRESERHFMLVLDAMDEEAISSNGEANDNLNVARIKIQNSDSAQAARYLDSIELYLNDTEGDHSALLAEIEALRAQLN